MNEVLHANIFFVIASVATVIFCCMVVIALYQLVKVLSAVRRIVERVEAGSEQLGRDLAKVRQVVVEGSLIARFVNFLFPSPSAPASKRKTSRRVKKK